MRNLRILVKLLLLFPIPGLFCFHPDTGNLSAQDLTSPLMKTGLIHKFGQHIVWPQEDGIDTFRIGMYGQDAELRSNLILLESVKLKDKPVSIKQFSQIGAISPTHILYITLDNNSELQRIVNQISGRNTLLVSDRARNQDLMMINLLPLTDGRADFEINKENIINAGLNITPDLLVSGGKVIDMERIFLGSRRALQRFKSQIAELSESYTNKSEQIEQLNQDIQNRNEEIESQREEIAKQKKLYIDQWFQIEQQQEAMDEHAGQLARLTYEVAMRQDTLDSKTRLLEAQENEISGQRKEIQNRNQILEKLEAGIASKELRIEEQSSQLSNFENRVARQRVFIYIIVAVIILVVWLVFFIYRSYKVKKDANKEIKGKNRELQSRQEEIVAQSEEILQANEEVISTNEALEIQKRKLEQTVENLKLAQSQLIQSEKMASVGVLTAGIAHELNNPINFVKGNVNPLKRDLSDILTLIQKYEDLVEKNRLEDVFKEAEEFKGQVEFSFLVNEVSSLLDGIEEGANRSSQIVKGLRSFSRMDEEQCQMYNIHEGIDSSLILLQNKMKDRISVKKEYGDLKDLECYPSKLNQVIMNILTNSVQAIEGKGEIFIQTVNRSVGIEIIIKDNGKGMTEEVKKHIFEPFFTTKDVGKGTGLGLSISFGIIEQHDGNIDVISEPGKGTEFILSLPKTQKK